MLIPALYPHVSKFAQLKVFRGDGQDYRRVAKNCNHRLGDGGRGGARAPKIREKYFRAIVMKYSGIFSGKNRVKFGNFVNFSGTYHKN